jgi:CelD/BcsL family acetyltransferase involved in cellulose biosynthesis
VTSSFNGNGCSSLELGDPRWEAFVRASPHAQPFHHPAWAQLLADCYGYRPFVLAIENGAGITAGLPVLEVARARSRRRWISLPFTDHCPPLTNDEMEPRLAGALDAARQKAGVSCFEVRAPLTGAAGYTTCPGVQHILELAPDPDTVFRRAHRSIRHNVHKAERSGLAVRRGDTAADLTETFYRLHLLTRRRQGVPVQPRRFFELLWRRVLEPGHGFVLIVSAGDEAVAGNVFLTWNGTIIGKYNASDPRAWPLKPNDAVVWAAIRWGCENGYTTLDFGRTELANEGLRRFKRGWGAREERLVYTTVADEPPKPSAGRMEKAARRVIRTSPAWVCRAAGELLYRFAA